MDWDKATTELEKPLNKQVVKTRKGGGNKDLSYIEAWHAIAEANRIFGFGSWSRHTVDLKMLDEPQRVAIGKTDDKAGYPGWAVAYFAKSRITVGDVVREGCGFGNGLDRDLGKAHELAIKEAETDSMKRALMTFGNPFGLALYDKTQAMVSDGNGADQPDQPDLGSIKGDGPSRHASHTPYAHLLKEMKRNDNPPDLNLWWVKTTQERERTLNSEHRWFLFTEMIKHGLDKACDLEEQKGFWTVHKPGLEKLKQRNASEYGGLEMYKEKVKKSQ
jgi:DNA repair and recombination protein RAD52